jgi:hypothetical protein
MTVTFHALWMLCALGAIVLAAAVTRPSREVPAFGVGVVAAALSTGLDRMPDPAVLGVLAAAAAAVRLAWPRYSVLAAAAGGALAGSASTLLEAQGLPAAVAVFVMVAIVGVTLFLSRARPAFAPDAIRDEGLLAVAALGIGVAILPGVLDGWQAAANLNVPAERDPAFRAIPGWTRILVGASVVSGGLYAVWSRR